MTPVAVHNKRTAADFISLPRAIYKNDPNWISPLEEEIQNIFLPQTNSFFSHGDCTRWVLYNEQHKPIGRIAAFVNYKKLHAGHNMGGIGFFE